MICDAKEGVCIAGVFGGLDSGVTDQTKNIFLESAWFNPVDIRKTSFRHGLRTDAAGRFEKGTDISNTVNVLKRAAIMIKEICGGEIASEVVDVYPHPKGKVQVALKYHYLKRLSGKNYHPDTVKEILIVLGFDVIKEGIDELVVAAPLNKPDISLPADVVEEIIRIDGLDNIEIPASIMMTPSIVANPLHRGRHETFGPSYRQVQSRSDTRRRLCASPGRGFACRGPRPDFIDAFFRNPNSGSRKLRGGELRPRWRRRRLSRQRPRQRRRPVPPQRGRRHHRLFRLRRRRLRREQLRDRRMADLHRQCAG